MALHSLRRDTRAALLHGTLDMLILRTLQRGPLRGHAIGQAILARSSAVLQVETGSLYPALQRLAHEGWVTSESGVTEANQRVKLYPLAPEGKKQLLREQARWRELVNAIDGVMNHGTAPSASPRGDLPQILLDASHAPVNASRPGQNGSRARDPNPARIRAAPTRCLTL